MRVGVLGPLEVTSADGTPLTVKGAKERLLLGVLTAEANRTVSVDRLTELLWDGAPPPTSVKTLQSHVVRLRTALEPSRPPGSPGRYIVRRGPGYALAVDRDEVDAVHFADAVARGRARLVSGEQAQARDEIAGALDLWRGEPYANWPDAAFADAERRRLAEIRVTAVESLLDADLALGRHTEAIAELERLTADDPLHEGWWSRLMLALYRAGRQGDALAAARRARTLLADELGVDPGTELTGMEDAILAQDPALSGAPALPSRLLDAAPEMCPYKGLATYEPEDAMLFYGRTRLVRSLVAALVDSPLLMISGPSGAGKSSVVRAGLLPALSAGALPGSEHWTPVVIIPGANPIDTLAPLLDRDAATPAVLVVDQFEELWTAGAEAADRRAYIDTLLGLQADGAVERLVIAVRADHLGRVSEHAGFAERSSREVVFVPPLSEPELREVVEGPAETAGLRAEPELVDAIVRDVMGRPGALPLLSTALVATWERSRANVLTLAGYLRAGGVEGSLARSAEAAFAFLDEAAQEQVQPMLVRLAGYGEHGVPVRRRVAWDELGLDGPDGDARRRALEALLDKRLLAADQDTFEVAHEALFTAWPRLAGWLADDVAGRAIRNHLVPAAKEWDVRGRLDDELYRGSRLATALEWRASNDPDLTSVERQFLDASEALADAELQAARGRAVREAAGRRRTRWLAASLGVALAGSMVAGAIALDRQGDAQREARIATARELAAAAVANLNVDPELSVLLALEAVEVTWDSGESVIREGEEALHRALKSHRLVGTFPQGGQGIAVSVDGARVATGGEDGVVTTWDVETGEAQLVITSPDVGKPALAMSPDNRLIATTHNDGTVRLWDANTGAERHVMEGHEGYGAQAAFSPDGSKLATSGEDAIIRVWDVSSGTEEMALTGYMDVSLNPAFSADGSRLASAGGGTAIVWDLDTGESTIFRTGDRWGRGYVAISPDGTRLVTAEGNSDRSAQIWDVESGALLQSLQSPAPLNAVAYSPDGTRIATGGTDGKARVWDAETGRELVTLAGHTAGIASVAFSSNGDRVVTGGHDDTTRVWDVSVGGSRDWLTVPGAVDNFTGVSFSPDGRRFAAPAEPSGVTIWDTRTGDEVTTLSGYEPTLATVAWSADANRLAAGSDATLTPPVWNVNTGELLFTLTGHEEVTRVVAFSPDGARIATGSWDGSARVWDASTGDQLAVLDSGSGVLAVAFSPDGRFILTGNNRGDVVVWDAVTLAQQSVLNGQQGPVEGLAFGRDGQLVTAGGDGTAKLWDLESGDELVTLRGHRGFVSGVAISSDGTRVATGSDDGTAKLWDAATGRELLTFFGHDQLVFGVDFSSDGRLLATASADGTVAVHLLPVTELVELARGRVTRDLTNDECRQYVHLEACP